MVSEGAHIVSLGDAFGKLKDASVAFADSVIAAHGNVAEHGDFFIAAPCLLPCLDQRAVMKIDVQRVVRAFQNIHLKDELGRFGEQNLLQPLQTAGVAFTVKSQYGAERA